MLTFARVTVAFFCLTILVHPAAAASQSFSDVPPNHPASAAVEYLRAQGIINGYADGTYKPAKGVNRAEALKIILASIIPEESLRMYTRSPFSDVPEGSWYLPYVEAGRTVLGIISGPPDRLTFLPENPVNKAEFLKMFLLSQRVNVTGSYGELQSPLASDVRSTDWHFPYVRYGMSASMLLVSEQGLLRPDAALTRGDVAQMMYHYFMYGLGKRTQALLSLTESEIVNVLSMIEEEQIEQAEYAAARATVASRGALASDPDKAIVKGVVKTAEGFQAIVRAYRAGTEGRADDAIRLSGEAWNLAAKAGEFSADLDEVALQLQALAKKIADSARALKT